MVDLFAPKLVFEFIQTEPPKRSPMHHLWAMLTPRICEGFYEG